VPEPATACAAIRTDCAFDSPAATPARARESMNSNTNAGEEPASAVNVPKCFSSRRSAVPTASNSSTTASTCASVDASLPHTAAAPTPTWAATFGMTRTAGWPSGRAASIVDSAMPAAIDTTGTPTSASASRADESTGTITCGLTARTTSPAPPTSRTSALASATAVPPTDRASASAASALMSVTSTSASARFATTPFAMAEAIAPEPMKPMRMVRTLPCGACEAQAVRAVERAGRGRRATCGP
jgi:hypothetical protein